MSRRPSRRVSEQVSGEAGRALATGLVATSGAMTVMEIDIALIEPNPEQPRRLFDAEGLEGLATSISHHGLLQPVLVKRHPSDPGRFILAAGERRWRAHKLIKRPTIRAIVVPGDIDEIAVIENAQRKDLHPVETAMALRRLSEQRGCTDEALATLTGLGRVDITKMIAVARLPRPMLESFLALTPPPAKSALFEVAMAPEKQRDLLAQAVREGASISDLRAARKGPPQDVAPGNSAAHRRGLGTLIRRLGSVKTILSERRKDAQPLGPEERAQLHQLRETINGLLDDGL